LINKCGKVLNKILATEENNNPESGETEIVMQKDVFGTLVYSINKNYVKMN
jgi:hypothetical protein